MGRRRKYPPVGVRWCQRCGKAGKFSKPAHLQRVCDECKSKPHRRVRVASDAKIRDDRARQRAFKALADRYPDEYAALLREEKALQGDGWTGVTLREIDDYERRVAEAKAAGWGKSPAA